MPSLLHLDEISLIEVCSYLSLSSLKNLSLSNKKFLNCKKYVTFLENMDDFRSPYILSSNILKYDFPYLKSVCFSGLWNMEHVKCFFLKFQIKFASFSKSNVQSYVFDRIEYNYLEHIKYDKAILIQRKGSDNVKHVDMSSSSVGNDTFKNISLMFPNTEILNFKLTMVSNLSPLLSLKNLKKLSLASRTLHMYSNSRSICMCSKLEEIDIKRCIIVDNNFVEILKNCTKLKKFHFTSSTILNTLPYVEKYGENIKNLDISSNHFRDKEISFFKGNKIEELFLSENTFSGNCLEGILSSNLKVLELYDTPAENRWMEIIYKKCPSITVLNIKQCRNITSTEYISKMKLEELYACGTHIDDYNFSLIGKIETLLESCFCNCCCLTDLGINKLLNEYKLNKKININLTNCCNIGEKLMEEVMAKYPNNFSFN